MANTLTEYLPLFTVDAAVTIDFGDLTEELPLPELEMYVLSYDGRAILILPKFTAEIRHGANGSGELPELDLFANGNIDPSIYGHLTLPKFTLSAEGTVENIASASLTLPELTLAATGNIDELGLAIGRMPIFTLDAHAAVGAFGNLTGILPRLTSTGNARGSVIVSATLQLPRFTLDISAHFGEVGNLGEVLPLLKITSTGYQNPRGTLTETLPLPELLADILNGVYSCVVMNIANTAISEYQQFQFNSFAKFNGEYLAASDNGIFVLAGASDSGNFISASFKTPTSDFGVIQLKRIYDVYLYGRLTGKMDVILTTEERDSYEYRTSGEGDGKLRTERIKTAKGPRSTTWDVEIRNVHGADFEVESTTLASAVLTRKVGRR